MPVRRAARPAIRFDGTVHRVGDRTLVLLPADASAGLPSRGQVAVEGTVAGRPLVTVAEPDGRRGHWLGLDEELCHDLGVDAGDTVAVVLEPAADWPEPVVPDDLGAALASAPDLDDVWAGITPMARWEWVRWIGATRNPQTRARRVEVGISKLRSGKRRPCCFDLASCTDPELSRSGKLVELP